MIKKALVVGINNYASPLYGCVNDATEMADLLRIDGNGDRNFDVRLELNTATRGKLRGLISELFSGDSEIALLYYSGHGYADHTGGYLVTPDHKINDVGVSMDEIVTIANSSPARNKVIILDCCYSGNMGNPSTSAMQYTQIREGVTILTACRSSEVAMEIRGHGIFTRLLMDALKGGAANITGHITPGSIYAYIDQALGAWQQRPVFKTNISRFISLRCVPAQVGVTALRNLTTYFSSPEQVYPLNPSYEKTNSPSSEHLLKEPFAQSAEISVFEELQLLESVGLVVPVGTKHMYFAAMESKSCRLTPLGAHYWRLAKEGKL